MSTVATEHETEAWRILLLANDGAELFALKKPQGIALPVLHVPRFDRLAANLNAEAQRSWNLEAVCAAPFSVAHPDGASGDARYHVMEALEAEELRRLAPRTMFVDALDANAFSDPRDHIAIRRAMKLDPQDSTLPRKGPFGDCGAFRKIREWVEQQLQPLGQRWNGNFRQLHASESFALIRFETQNGAMWFKATGEPNQRELAISEQLFALFPSHVPDILSVHREWNAWLTNEAPGISLESHAEPSAWGTAAERLAEMQIASIGHIRSILRCGAHDSRPANLIAEVSPFFAQIETLMERQTKTVPPRLRTSEIRALELRIVKAIAQMEAAGIPNTLNHFDLNASNVIVHSETCRFLDWAEAAVGNPFLSFEYFRQHFLQVFPDNPQAAANLTERYVRVWRKHLSESAVNLALELIPLVAPFAFAAMTLPWNDSYRNAKPEFGGFLRSLARRMHRESEQLGRAA